jgi:hypothetical protein
MADLQDLTVLVDSLKEDDVFSTCNHWNPSYQSGDVIILVIHVAFAAVCFCNTTPDDVQRFNGAQRP